MIVVIILDSIYQEKTVFRGKISLNSARVVCAIVLHMQIMPEIRCGMELINFTINNPNAFFGSGNMSGFALGWMKLVAGIFTEIINMVIIVFSETIEDVVKDYIAFGVISSIDDLMLGTVHEIKFIAKDNPIPFPTIQLKYNFLEKMKAT